jgi:hypothetical protein
MDGTDVTDRQFATFVQAIGYVTAAKRSRARRTSLAVRRIT